MTRMKNDQGFLAFLIRVIRGDFSAGKAETFRRLFRLRSFLNHFT